jgi:hypothetical protein
MLLKKSFVKQRKSKPAGKRTREREGSEIRKKAYQAFRRYVRSKNRPVLETGLPG